jgi:hypothetical protein
MRHILIDVDPSADTAKSASYYVVRRQLDGFPLQPILAGKYLDRFERHDGNWRFVRRTVTVHLLGDLRRHVTASGVDVAKRLKRREG